MARLLRRCILAWLVAVAMIVAGRPAGAADMSPAGSKNFTPPSSVPGYFNDESEPFLGPDTTAPPRGSSVSAAPRRPSPPHHAAEHHHPRGRHRRAATSHHRRARPAQHHAALPRQRRSSRTAEHRVERHRRTTHPLSHAVAGRKTRHAVAQHRPAKASGRG